jgi:hypothetical protein
MADRERHPPVEHPLPRPTIWPATMAAGVTLLATGVATNLLVSLGGLILMALATRGWIHDLLTGAAPADTGDAVDDQAAGGRDD